MSIGRGSSSPQAPAPSGLWTVIIVTLIAVIIWFLADSETRDQKQIGLRVSFVAAAPPDEVWSIRPAESPILVTVEGSRVAVRRAEQLAARRFELPVPATAGTTTINVLELLRNDRTFIDAGVALVSSPEAEVTVDLDRIVSGLAVSVRPVLPNILVDGEVAVRPEVVTIAMAGRDIPENGRVTVEARPTTDLSKLVPGEQYTVRADLNLPRGVQGTLSDSSVELTFRVQSRTARHTLPTVRVQIGGPPEDHEDFSVRIADSDTVLSDVEVEARSDLIAQIRNNDVKVVAMVYLTNQDKVRRVETRRISGFVALFPDGSMHTIAARVGTEERPEVSLVIEERAAEPIEPPDSG